MEKEKKILLFISLTVVFLITAILYFQPPFFNQWIIQLEKNTYDQEVRLYHAPLSPHPSIAIVAIDDLSLEKEGRWPWDRSKIAQLTTQLDRLGASVVVFDMVFSEPQENPVDIVLKALNNPPNIATELNDARERLDADSVFADALKKGKVVLGFALSSQEKREGTLPKPLLSLTEEKALHTLISEMEGFIGNLALFQEATPFGGFINTTIDADGILRFSPLLLRVGENVYPALALQAAQTFLSLQQRSDKDVGIHISKSKDQLVVESIELGDMEIRTDPWGRILVPFRGSPFSFPYLSATDVLSGKVKKEDVEGKLIFIGVTATAFSDFFATAISPVFPGVEIQATIASGIIDRYLPYKPNWGRGGAVALVLIIGIIAAVVFPHIGRVASFSVCLLIIVIMQAANYWFWKSYQIVLAFFFPMPTLIILFLLDFFCAYVGDKREKGEIKRLLGRKVPPDILDEIIRKKGDISLKGESKELTVLFADIWEFPRLTGSFSALELKQFLHHYLSELNQVIFDEKGIVDRYVRDEIMALWNAPLSVADHAYLAVKSAFAIQSLKLSMQIGIGINTGIAHVGDMGSKFHSSYTAIGKTVDLALHLKNLTKAYSVPIIVGESTKKLTQDRISYRKLDSISFDGETIEIFEPRKN